MKFSIKNTLPLLLLFFTCSFLRGVEATEEDPYLIEYRFFETDDYLKVKIVFPEGTNAKSTVYKINNPDAKGVSVQIKHDQPVRLETFYQLVDIEVHALPSQEDGGVTFTIIENLEKKPTDNKTVSDRISNSAKYFINTDKQINFRNDVLPQLTVSKNAPHIKYLRFYTKP